uniref:hypothetical protein n=1 Tax=Paractinoplanes polyasparticus TaxID=2856853 RepID=UPI001C85965C|nr:hypothetical protein [Actinoplanes polyasparticus]
MRRALVVVGALVMAYAVAGAVGDAALNLVGVAVFLVAVLALHDALFLPIVLAAGALIRRLVPPPWQATVRWAAVAGVAVLIVGLPLAWGFGRDAGNPTVLPRPYGAGLGLVLAAIAVSAVAGRKGIERWRRRRPPPPPG